MRVGYRRDCSYIHGVIKINKGYDKQYNNTIIQTPETFEQLEQFAKANGGSNDWVLMQMALQFGYKMGLKDNNNQK